MLPLRLSKILLLAASGLFFAVVFFDNVTDYDSNFQFVRHVLSMDDTFKGNRGLWRALPYPLEHHLFYATIIGTEAFCSIFCTYGAFQLYSARLGTSVEFAQAKLWGTIGLTLALLLWFVAFISIGGEWFLMWQSQTWNGQNAAFRMFTLDMLILLFLWQQEDPQLLAAK